LLQYDGKVENPTKSVGTMKQTRPVE